MRLGLESLKSQFDVLLVALSDQPEIGVTEIQALLEVFMERAEGEEVVLPMIDGQRGNPVVFSQAAIATILQTPGMVCRAYMDSYPNKVKLMQTSAKAYLVDVDTPEDIQRQGLTRA